MTNPPVSRIEKILWPQGERRDIWMIVDAARDRAIFRMLLEGHLESCCLHKRFPPSAPEITAPHLVQLECQGKNTRRLLQHAWGNHCGIFLKCDLGRDRLRNHLCQFLTVRDPRGRRLVFRYYDPRVLRVYLPTCFEEELRTVFGPIQSVWTEGQLPNDMLEFRFHRGRLAQGRLALDSETASDLRAAGSGRNSNAAPRVETPPRPALLTLRQAQLAILSRIEAQRFEDSMVAHLSQHFPAQSKCAGEADLRETIQYGIKRAAAYGITSERDVCKYIDLMVVYGRDFDTDERFAWTRDILSRQEDDAGRKIEALREAAKGRLRRA